ncbi:calcipressin-1-like isoform X2 [Pomacea canaliculata]|uniref:calcipressin-1-like isoform X2 n=1 Tax=Pomacea canaliculata TaxID=400727 RepID=UPI000D730436|nr:calcipressin-1-like isoform X2 [Pomacea canaliculata]XP_025096873.1 calcipressin-1-like isoform X2 [Pomacea canaliculata]
MDQHVVVKQKTTTFWLLSDVLVCQIETKMAEDDEMSEIADALIITNLETAVFDDAAFKSEFEAAFKEYDSGATFNYLKSFRRARVNFSTTEATVQARLGLNDKVVCGQPIKCYFAQVPKSTDDHLHPPKPEKMFLISPPCSPPVGWEQHREAEPVLNFELIQALSNLSPGNMWNIAAVGRISFEKDGKILSLNTNQGK